MTRRQTTKSSSITLLSRVFPQKESKIDRTGAQTGSLAMTLFHLVYFRRRIQVASFFRGHFASTTSCAIIYGVGGYYHIKNDDPAINYDRAFRFHSQYSLPRDLSSPEPLFPLLLQLTLDSNITVYRIDVTSFPSFSAECPSLWVFSCGQFHCGRVG